MEETSPTEEYTSANSSPDHLSFKSCQSPNVTSNSSELSSKQPQAPKQLQPQSSPSQQLQQPSPIQPPNTLPVSRSESFSTETIYELVRSPFSDQHPAATHVVSERVQTLASQIYNELQRIMSRFSSTEDDEAVSGLMPLIVNVLESLDLSIIENQQLQVELELCKDDNEQLAAAFEKEKGFKKKVEQRLLELEFQAEEEKQQLSQKIESLESIMRILELKAKNSADHSNRLEEKEMEMKTEYNKLHTRYTELLRSHCDLMERVKILIGNEDFSGANNSSGPPSLAASTALRNFLTRKLEMDATLEETEQKNQQAKAREGDLLSPVGPRPAWIDTELSLEDASIIEDVDDIPRDQQPQSLSSHSLQQTRDRSERDREKERDSHSLTATRNGSPVSSPPHPPSTPASTSAASTANPSTVTDREFFGMEKEVENLISENNELLATKNALNIVKDDLINKVDALESELTMSRNENQQLTAVKNCLKQKTSQLDEENKKLKENIEELKMKLKEDDEEGVPIVQRKRFTRIEMARVLMERNQYKEKLIELQEAVRWTELIRASKTETKEKSAIWKFFSNLFTTSSTGTREGSSLIGTPGPVPGSSIRYNAPNTTVTPALDALRRRANPVPGTDMALLMDSDLSIERARALRNVRAQVNKSSSGDRVHAYGWSIAINPRMGEKTNVPSESSPVHSNNSNQNDALAVNAALIHTSVPVPTYCRPLSGDEVGMKIWCASAVDLSGGEMEHNFGLSYSRPVAASTSSSHTSTGQQASSDIETASVADSGLNDSINSSKDQISNASYSPGNGINNNYKGTNTTPSKRLSDGGAAIAALETELSEALSEQNDIPSENSVSTFVWICSVSQSKSKVTIINIRNNPSEVLDSFLVKTHLLCIASVPGVKASDCVNSLPIDTSIFGIRSCTVKEVKVGAMGRFMREEPPVEPAQAAVEETVVADEAAAESTGAGVVNTTLEKLTEFLAYTEPPASPAKEDVATPTSPVYQPMSSKHPTMWLGGQNGVLYVHSSMAQWSHCVASLKLSDSILQITHYRGRVFVALANGQCCVFLRDSSTLEWDFSQYYVIDIALIHNQEQQQASHESSLKSGGGDSSAKTPSGGSPPISMTSSIRCLEVAKGNIWMGYRNLVFILDPKSLKVITNFPIHPRKESQVRQLSALGDGVWCSLRMDSTLRLYSAVKPFQHLQDIDIEPYVSKMLSPKAFTFIRTTALKASGGRLWIGTANGVILSIPCDKYPAKESPLTSLSTPSVVVSNPECEKLALSTFTPTVNQAAAQLSFHGHRDAVKFFVCTKNLVLSGGDGYIDFRADEDDPSVSTLTRGDRSHLIVWEMTAYKQQASSSSSRLPSSSNSNSVL